MPVPLFSNLNSQTPEQACSGHKKHLSGVKYLLRSGGFANAGGDRRCAGFP